MPCVGNHGGAVEPFPYTRCVLVKRFFGYNRHCCHHQRNHRWCGNCFAVNHMDHLVESIDKNADSHGHQRHADEESCESLEFAVSVAVVFVDALGGDADKYDHDDIGDEIAERVDTIGNHSARPADDAGDDFE